MTERGDAAELRDLFRKELLARLEPDGWTPIEEDGAFELAAFIRPLDEDFAATAAIGCASSVPDRPPVLVTNLHVGVSYEPLRGLWPLLGDRFRLALLHDRLRGDEEGGQLDPLKIATSADAAGVADEVAKLVLDHAVAFATPLASLDVLLDELEDDEDPDYVDDRVPALLAAAGRFDEARDALARFDPERGYSEGTRDAKQFARQLERWIDSEGDPALLPHAPPPPRFARSERKSASELWHEARARNDAVEAAQRASAGKDRDELRARLEAELGQRGLTESPLWFEQKLDELGASRAQQAQRTAEGLKTLGRLGLGVVKAIRERKLPDLSRPAWLDPPDRAAYRLPRGLGNHWTAVNLDSDAGDWLDRVHEALPKLLGRAVDFDAWLDWAADKDGSRLAVHVAERRVGTLDADAASAFVPVMNAAAEREELPSTTARLTPRPGDTYLVELQLPAPAQR